MADCWAGRCAGAGIALVACDFGTAASGAALGIGTDGGRLATRGAGRDVRGALMVPTGGGDGDPAGP